MKKCFSIRKPLQINPEKVRNILKIILTTINEMYLLPGGVWGAGGIFETLLDFFFFSKMCQIHCNMIFGQSFLHPFWQSKLGYRVGGASDVYEVLCLGILCRNL